MNWGGVEAGGFDGSGVGVGTGVNGLGGSGAGANGLMAQVLAIELVKEVMVWKAQELVMTV